MITTLERAFLTMLGMPLTFSMANGLAPRFCAWTLIRILRGRFREVGWTVYLLIARFWYLGNA